MTEVLVADSIAKTLGGRRILSAATLRVSAGEFKVLLGKNGVGKSTLLKIAVGVLPPDTGFLRCGGQAMTSWTLAGLAKLGVFYLPEHGLLSDSFTIRDQLSMFATRFGQELEDPAARLGVLQYLDKRPSELSTDQRRRCDLAAATIRRPSCLVADEPFRDLSPIEAERLAGVFAAFASAGWGIVASGHEVGVLLASASAVTWCTSGTTYELGSPSKALEHEAFRREYLGV